VPHLDEIELVASAVERADEAVDPVAGISKDPLYAPGGEPFPEKIAYRLSHAISFMLTSVVNQPQSRAASSGRTLIEGGVSLNSGFSCSNAGK
jgi:hypothetical protein